MRGFEEYRMDIPQRLLWICEAAMSEQESARERMVEKQIRARGISDAGVLRVMGQVPRHRFLSARSRSRAYEDSPVSIGYGQTISQPYMVALMTATLAVGPDDRVLEIGTGSGYQTAVLAGLAGHVDSVERIAALSGEAGGVLSGLGIANVTLHTGDGSLGLEERAPFDGILVTAGAPSIPDTLVTQLKEGGRLVIPVGDASHQMLYKVVREPAGPRKEAVTGCVFVPLIGTFGWNE
jgi:protein-L-isoaspartate(D-aspartate) O-methyltransferase